MTDSETRLEIKTHGDYSITYNTMRQEFQAVKDGEVKLKAISESDLVGKVDNAIKRQKKVTTSNIFPMNIYYKINQQSLIEAKITSMAEDGEFWVSWKVGEEGHRQKMSARWHEYDFYPINEKTTTTKERASSLNIKLETIRQDIKSTLGELGKGIDLESLTKIEEENK